MQAKRMIGSNRTRVSTMSDFLDEEYLLKVPGRPVLKQEKVHSLQLKERKCFCLAKHTKASRSQSTHMSRQLNSFFQKASNTFFQNASCKMSLRTILVIKGQCEGDLTIHQHNSLATTT